MARRTFVQVVAVTVAALLVLGCGEPGVELAVPERGNAWVLDDAGILDEAALAPGIAALAELGWDVVALTFETEAANMGTADRAGRRLLEAWDADIVLVAVAAPGHFDRDDADRRRFFGLFAAEVRAVPRGLRERIVEHDVPPLAAGNAWTEAFRTALDALHDGLAS